MEYELWMGTEKAFHILSLLGREQGHLYFTAIVIEAQEGRITRLRLYVEWMVGPMNVIFFLKKSHCRGNEVKDLEMRSWTFCTRAKLLQSCLTLCDPMDHSPPGSSVHEILQARILEWVAMPSSRGSSWPRDWTWVSYVFCLGRWVLYLGSP